KAIANPRVLLPTCSGKTSFAIKTFCKAMYAYKERGVQPVKYKLGLSLMMVGLLLAAGCASSAGDSQSNSQSDVTAEEEEDRIVATSVALREIMDKLELDLVGIPTSYKDLPERYAEAEEVGNPMEPDMEIIKSLQPTDVLSVTTLQSDLEDAFEKADIPVTFIDLESVEGMYDAIR